MQERKDLAATLKDTRTVVGRLELLIAFVVHIAFIFFYLLIFQVAPLVLAAAPRRRALTIFLAHPHSRLLRLYLPLSYADSAWACA